jgi:hypothetical protein
MHLVEAYSAATRLRIAPMEIETHSFPMPFTQKYVVIITSTGAPAKNYQFWRIVCDWLKPALNAAGYVLVQAGGEKDERIGANHDICGKTTTLQYFDVIKNAALVVCGDTSAVHVAGHFNVPFVALYSISPPEVSKAYFGNPYLQKYLTPKDYTPSYNPNESPAAINKIKPEEVVQAAFELLKMRQVAFKTLHAGVGYPLHVLEIIPNVILRPESIPGQVLNIRFDKGGVERAVYDQLALRKCSVSTKAPLDVNILKSLRSNIDFIAYEIDENHSPKFAQDMMREQVPFRLFSNLPNERLNPIKLDYFDIAVIAPYPTPERVECPIGTKFRTNRKILSNSKIYLSHAHVLEDKPVDGFDKTESIVIDSPEFWRDKELYYIYA